ncbi:hypothetical protein RCL_jg17492.t1 [Rhizophagus clarus]|uniref:Uncharacterized protein n=1 Tax=Rhizophagus clarus TaxID=94130 RepID=A0A8H3QD23_9GLOM|nr:hypothetical protein RCL_jg17492.t1 [Rhizophagus clarus]
MLLMILFELLQESDEFTAIKPHFNRWDMRKRALDNRIPKNIPVHEIGLEISLLSFLTINYVLIDPEISIKSKRDPISKWLDSKENISSLDIIQSSGKGTASI